MKKFTASESSLPIKYVVAKFVESFSDFTRTNDCPSNLSLRNATSLKRIHSNLIKFIHAKFGPNTPEILRGVGIDKAEKLIGYVYDHAEEIENNHGEIKKFKDFQLSKSEQAFLKYKSEHPEEFATIDDKDAQERDLVVYNRYNPSHHKIYRFRGTRGKHTNHQVNDYRQDFYQTEGVKYYNCYPCLYSYYIEHFKDLETYNDTIGIDD